MNNEEIARLLRNVAAAYVIKNEKKYRFQIIAYQRAADAITGTSEQLYDLYKEEKLENIPGVGPSIREHLEELFKTGKVKHFKWVFKGIPQSVFPLLEVPTLGPKKAFKLVTEFRLAAPKTVVKDVLERAKKSKIAVIEGFGKKSQEDIIRAINEYKKGEGKTQRMVLPYAFEVAQKLLEYLRKSPDVMRAEPLGSLRRMAPTIGDVDIAVATNKPGKVVDYFTAYPKKERVIEKGETTASILTSGGKQIDLMTMPSSRFGSLLQHFTGSKNHNIHLREYALSKGISLSEYGMKRLNNKSKEIKKFDSEENFYHALGLEWIPPELREDTGEIEAASYHKLPKLIELSDIKGDLHIHSSHPIEPSHDLGQNTMEEMLKKANSLNYEYLGFSEHNPSQAKHTNDSIYSIISRRYEHIEQLKSSNKSVRIINLLEVDILPNGKLALDEKSLSKVDAVIVSIHSVFGMNKKDMTKRVLEGLSHPKAKILAHPTGRMLNERPGYELEWDKIFDFVKKNKKALEINAWYTRLDLPDTLVKQSVKNGVKMVIDTDSHAVWQMDLMKYGVAVARRGWAIKDDILNTLQYNKFIEWLKQ